MTPSNTEADAEPTETSALLTESTAPIAYLTDPVVGAIEHTNGLHRKPNGGTGVLQDENQAISDEERNGATTDEVDEARLNQFEGMPEVKKQLKFILPAVGIGVSHY